MSLISVWRGTAIHGDSSWGFFIKYAYMHLSIVRYVESGVVDRGEMGRRGKGKKKRNTSKQPDE